MREHPHICSISTAACSIVCGLILLTIFSVKMRNEDRFTSPGFIASFQSCTETCSTPPPDNACVYARNVTLQWSHLGGGIENRNITYTEGNFTGDLFGCSGCCLDQIGVQGFVTTDEENRAVAKSFSLLGQARGDSIVMIILMSLLIYGACCCLLIVCFTNNEAQKV
jgi:hypothetical protein